MKIDANTRFEIVAELYRRATGHMAPGKSSVTEDSGCDENWERFCAWREVHLGAEAVDRIAFLEDRLKHLGQVVDDLDLL